MRSRRVGNRAFVSCASRSTRQRRRSHLKILQYKTRSDAERQKLQFLAATVKNSPKLELSNGGFYMRTGSDPVDLRVPSNRFEGVMSADAAGITVCLFAYSHLSFQFPAEARFSQHFYQLRAYALEHPEVSLIFAAID